MGNSDALSRETLKHLGRDGPGGTGIVTDSNLDANKQNQLITRTTQRYLLTAAPAPRSQGGMKTDSNEVRDTPERKRLESPNRKRLHQYG